MAWFAKMAKLLAMEDEVRLLGDPVTPKARRPRCGAKCRSGKPCQAPAVWDYDLDSPRNGRCRMHGGLSTGPKTEEGKRRSREGARRGGRKSAERRWAKRDQTRRSAGRIPSAQMGDS
jgi:hypothetical protein